MLLQANDFRHLCQEHDVEMQMGGSDQWGNITAGIDLIRRRLSRSAFGLTWPLLLKSDGTKFGKTAAGAVWLDAERTSPYQFRQFWMNIDDDMVATLLPRCSLTPLVQVQAVLAEHAQAPERRVAQRALADELTEVVHGPAAVATAREAAEVLFGGDPTTASRASLEAVAREVPTSVRAENDLNDPVTLLVDIKMAASKSEARRLLEQGAVRANGAVISADVDLYTMPRLHESWILLRRGRTSHHLVKVSGV
jgi:tyrosyl-tRNA synthetase